MPAESKSQHGIMGMALAYKRGKIKASDLPAGVRNKVKQIAASMSEKQLVDFTSTKARKLPKHVGKGPRRRIRKTRSS
jgi:hypothetical protein